MILPINLTGRLGLPDGGVPIFSLDPSTGEIIGAGNWPGGSAIDPATGEPLPADSSYSNEPGLWMSNSNPNQNILQTAPLRESRGTQWNRRGSFLTESGFDKWRRAGKPTACSMGDYTLPNGVPCDPTMIGAPMCEDTTQRIIQAIAAGTETAAGSLAPSYPYGGGYGSAYPGYTPIPGGGSVTVSGGASPGAWLFGGLIVVGLIYAMSRR